MDPQAFAQDRTQRADARSDPRLDWWRAARFGLFIHWGLYAIPAGHWQGQAVPGIGKRTAERIIVELREKVAPADGSEPAIVVTRGDDPRRLARDGLLELGFPPAEVDALLAVAEGESPEELLQSALKAARR